MTRKSTFIAIFLIVTIVLFFYLKTDSTEIIPQEDPASQEKLNNAITISKLNIDEGISTLNKLSNLSDYTEYKKKYVLAKLYEKKNDISQALSILKTIADINYPLKERVLFRCAELNTIQGNDNTAIKTFNDLIHQFPNSKSIPQAQYYLAQAQLRVRLVEQAINTLTSLRKSYPKTQYGIATSYYLGEIAYNKGNYNEALGFWRAYLKQSPDGRFASEIAGFLSDKTKFQLKPLDYSLLGDVFFHKKDYQNAGKYYKFENNIKKYYQLGYSLFRTNQKPEAISYLKQYAYHFPKAKNVRWALYYAALCTPSYSRKLFWSTVSKDIPSLSYYSKYKEALLEPSFILKEHKLKDFMKHYPSSDFLLDAVWEIMWQKIKDRNYNSAREVGAKYFELTKNTDQSRFETRGKIGFWLGKIAEFKDDIDVAKSYYTSTQNIIVDNYYSLRSANRLLELNEQSEDPRWNLQYNGNSFKNFIWSIPGIVKSDTIKRHYGTVISELIKLQQYDEAMDLIGKNKSPSKQVTAWLKALNTEYENSINISSSLINNYGGNLKRPIWKLAYPIHFWQFIFNSSKKYSNLDPFLVCGLIRQESKFDQNALSTSNARGLMQFIPETARSVAREIGIKDFSQNDLYNPEINIALGTHYINSLINELKDALYAVGSYNAGPQAMKRWIKTISTADNDLFLEQIPYDETRNYIKKVFANYWTYINLYK